MNKTILMTILAAGFMFAQAPAPKAAPKATPKAAPAAPNLLVPSTLRGRAPETFKVKMTTTKGDLIIEVTRAWAPIGVDRFYNLVRAGFYTNAAFFRVLPGFVAQFGISARPEVSAAWDNARMLDDRVIQSNKRGTLTYAKTGAPNSRGTQIFINYADNARLDGDGFAAFGQVVEGMELADKFFSGYGEQPDQGRITGQGKAYLDRSFPNLDRIISATIMPADAPAAADTKK